MFKEKSNGRTDEQTDARRTTGHNISLLAYGQWSLKSCRHGTKCWLASIPVDCIQA